MREIKFRVFDKDYKKMHIVGKDGHDSLTCWDGKIQYYNLQNGEGSGEHGSYILMQYTGLTDKNGKEIYEGDIVECFVNGNSYVSFKGGAYGLIFDYSFIPFSDVYGEMKVIGNIYEHPHLLEESK